MAYNINKIREDFPALKQNIDGKPPIYFDNACMTLRPRSMVEAMDKYYFKYPGCHRRAIHKFGKITTAQYQKARETVRGFINAKEANEIIFTRNTTESINLVANSFPFKEGDVVVTTDLEHNSNLIPWQILSKKKGITHKIFSLDKDLTFDLEKFKEVLAQGVKLVSIFHTSHVTGCSLPIEQIIQLAHQHKALVFLDCAQSIGHKEINVQKLDVDFLAFSFHKILGPSGMGALYTKIRLLEDMTPFLVGGETVDDVDYNSFSLSKIPDRFESGLQNYAGAIGSGAAINYLKAIGMRNIQKQELKLNEFITEGILSLPRVNLLGPKSPRLRGGVINFYLEGMDSGELSIILDQTNNIMVRSGFHCSHPWYKKYNLPPTIRVSVYFYNTIEEAKIFTQTLKKIVKHF